MLSFQNVLYATNTKRVNKITVPREATTVVKHKVNFAWEITVSKINLQRFYVHRKNIREPMSRPATSVPTSVSSREKASISFLLN